MERENFDELMYEFGCRFKNFTSSVEIECMEKIRKLEKRNEILEEENGKLINEILIYKDSFDYAKLEEYKNICQNLSSELEEKKSEIKELSTTIDIYEYDYEKSKNNLELINISKLPPEDILKQLEFYKEKSKLLEEDNKRFRFLEHDYNELENKYLLIKQEHSDLKPTRKIK